MGVLRELREQPPRPGRRHERLRRRVRPPARLIDPLRQDLAVARAAEVHDQVRVLLRTIGAAAVNHPFAVTLTWNIYRSPPGRRLADAAMSPNPSVVVRVGIPGAGGMPVSPRPPARSGSWL